MTVSTPIYLQRSVKTCLPGFGNGWLKYCNFWVGSGTFLVWFLKLSRHVFTQLCKSRKHFFLRPPIFGYFLSVLIKRVFSFLLFEERLAAIVLAVAPKLILNASSSRLTLSVLLSNVRYIHSSPPSIRPYRSSFGCILTLKPLLIQFLPTPEEAVGKYLRGTGFEVV